MAINKIYIKNLLIFTTAHITDYCGEEEVHRGKYKLDIARYGLVEISYSYEVIVMQFCNRLPFTLTARFAPLTRLKSITRQLFSS